MSNITELASGQINSAGSITIELVQADETPAVVIVRWPLKATVLHPHRFQAAADIAARTFAVSPHSLPRWIQLQPEITSFLGVRQEA
jgi:hypothetical protein